MGNRIKFSTAAALITLVCSTMLSAFTDKDIISPASGTWANAQPIVLNTSDGSDLYYSLTSSDPLSSGFMYDGPVVIDGTGNIVLHVTAVSRSGVRSDYVISYAVMPPSQVALSEEGAAFINNVTANPLRKYISGTNLVIPAELKYSIGSDEAPSLSGRTLTVSPLNKLERYIPCTVTDGASYWRFVIHTFASQSELVSGKTVPFTIDDWETFKFTGEKLIYQIDDAYWSADKAPLVIDRSIPHVVRWQSMEYELGNPVERCILPAKPQLVCNKNESGGVTFSIQNDKDPSAAIDKKFQLGPAIERSDSGTIASGLYTKIDVDTFEGDTIGGTLKVSVFYDGVYQGILDSPFVLDKKPPLAPVIASSAHATYARDKVTLTITAEPDAKIMYAVSSPLESETGFLGEEKDQFNTVPQGTFIPYTGDPVVLKSTHDKADFFKVNAYAVDAAGNKSEVVEYRVVVDEYNYYLTADKASIPNGTSDNVGEPDGTYGNPFTTFAQALKAMSGMEYTQLHITGDVVLDRGETVIASSCRLIGDNSRIIIPQDGYITVQGASVEAENCVFEKDVDDKKNGLYVTDKEHELFQKMFMLEKSTCTFKNCELIGVFSFDGILINATDSELNLSDCGLTVQGDTYTCAVSAKNTKVTAEKQRVTCSAVTTVCFSIHGGSLSLTKSTCKVIGHLGRIVELIESNGTVTGNICTAEIDSKAQDVTAIWKDVDTVLTASDNDISGFSL